eukprot:TRINITY_DN6113_c0_g1_i4.p1 TRINITY_DN6113_c0_g1~~TRINITY_DN6113_c0_g1_i4.p1  ORF type:complete len:458 (+),score=104.22 TRINITY_DN6113_c0_g1_i4:53-1375(+)
MAESIPFTSSSEHCDAKDGDVRCVTMIVVGAGQRGTGYAEFALDYPHRLKVVGVADPRKFYRERMQRAHDIPEDRVFSSWEELVATGQRLADVVAIALPDALHAAAAVALAPLKYHILLEKPMAVSEDDCRHIAEACRTHDVMLAVCHVLRYMPANRMLKQLIDDGTIGELVHIQHLEPVGYFHFAHSFVRGNWKKEATSTFSLMAKSCHDIDLIRYWAGRQCARVSSFGSLQHFRADKKPVEAGEATRCLDCPAQQSCPYSAVSIYLERARKGHRGWPVSVITEVPIEENVYQALATGPYGQCVYSSDNDVVDHQVVNLEFAEGVTAAFTMVAFTEKICQRQTQIYGSRGQLMCVDEKTLSHFDFATQTTRLIACPLAPADTRLKGHGGADYFLMEAFVNAVAHNNPSLLLTNAEDALASHLLVFAAEKSRLTGQTVTL